MRAVAILLALLVVVATLVPATASDARPSCERGGDARGLFQPTPLELPASCRGEQSGDDRGDAFRFDLGADDMVNLSVASVGNATFDVCLYRPHEAWAACALASAAAPASISAGGTEGAWRVEIERGNAGGAYDLDALASPRPRQDDCGSGHDAGDAPGATLTIPLPLACAGTVSASLDPEDGYTLETEPGAYYEMRYEGNGYACTPGVWRCIEGGGRALLVADELSGDPVRVRTSYTAESPYLLSFITLPPPLPQDDCGAGRDVDESAPLLVGLVLDCGGTLDATYEDTSDVYRVDVPEGASAWLDVAGGNATACLLHADGSPGGLCADERGLGLDSLRGGAYVLYVALLDVGEGRHGYVIHLRVGQRMQEVNGLFVATVPASPGALTGPLVPGVVDAWVRLDATATGSERFLYGAYGLYLPGGAHARFYDESLVELGSPCLELVACAPPSGAAWVLLSGTRTSADVRWGLVYVHE